VKRERQLDDGIEPGKRSVTRPHFFDENPAVPATKQMHRAAGQNRFSEPISRLLNRRLLLFDRCHECAALAEVISAWSHGRAR
jgi:hypothetical protein